MRGILSRVLTEEIENQKIWWENEQKDGVPDEITNRKNNIERIEKFMAENDIPKFFKCYQKGSVGDEPALFIFQNFV